MKSLKDQSLTNGPEQLFSAVQRKRMYSESAVKADRVDSYCQPKRTKMEKNVRFSNTDIVTVINSGQTDISSALWYQEDEYQRIRQEARETIVMFQKCGCLVDSVHDCEKYCIRGLERALAAVIFRVLSQRNRKIVRSVLCQQQILRQNGRVDDEALRLSSTVVSTFDKQKAWRRALSEKLVI
jgi:uncharacterized protein (DUF1810 family)